MSESLSVEKGLLSSTYHAAEAVTMPLVPQSFHDHVRDGLSALVAFGTVAIGVTSKTPGVSFLFDEWRLRVERLCCVMLAVVLQ